MSICLIHLVIHQLKFQEIAAYVHLKVQIIEEYGSFYRLIQVFIFHVIVIVKSMLMRSHASHVMVVVSSPTYNMRDRFVVQML